MAFVVDHTHSSPFLPRNPKLVGEFPPYNLPSVAYGHPHTHPDAHQASPMTASTSAASGPVNLFSTSVHNQLPSGRAGAGMKRVREDEDENGYYLDDRRASPSDPMETRSPTPDASRPRRAPPKRMRPTPAHQLTGSASKDKQEDGREPDVDVGLLLARCSPEQSRSILTKLMTANPELKSQVLALIPPPDIAMATHDLVAVSRKLRDAYPYAGSSTSFGFGFGFGSAPVPAAPAMRPEYIRSRIQAPVDEFVSTALSYLPYFSQAPTQVQDRAPPSIPDRFTFLSTVTQHILEQQPLAVDALTDGLRRRLGDEWQAWVRALTQAVCHEGRMFPLSVAEDWIRRLDTFADQTHVALGQDMRVIRDGWVQRVGWLVGRTYST